MIHDKNPINYSDQQSTTLSACSLRWCWKLRPFIYENVIGILLSILSLTSLYDLIIYIVIIMYINNFIMTHV
jgi:hypothetical protein